MNLKPSSSQRRKNGVRHRSAQPNPAHGVHPPPYWPRRVHLPPRWPRRVHLPPRWPQIALWLGFFGVLLGGCQRPGSAAARPESAGTPSRTARRVGSIVPSATGQERLSYSVQVDSALTRLEVTLCTRGFRIERLNEPSPDAHRWLEGEKIVTPEGDRACPSEGVDLPQFQAGECLNYAVVLPPESPDPTSVRRLGTDLLASPDYWLWVPTPRPRALDMRVRFVLPNGVHVGVPWQELRASAGATENRAEALEGSDARSESGPEFVLSETAFAWKSAGAFSHVPFTPLAVVGTQLRLLPLAGGFAAQEAQVEDWVADGARVANALFGTFPVKSALVLLVPSDRAGPAGSFGMALRGGGPAVVIFLDRHARAATLRDDGTATHEFLHLGVPRLAPEDAWLFEGLATYYTELTRARVGRISARQAYQHLLQGFARGKSQASSLTLRDESAQMHERHSYLRVYWAGAALAFLTDLAARRAGGPTLDAALRTFAECCAASEDNWSAERVLAHLDQALGAPWFATEARRWLDDREFPALDATLHALGVSVGPHDEAIFGRAPQSELRDALMARAALTVPRSLPTEPDRDVQQRQEPRK